MQKRKLGKSGLEVSAIGLGCSVPSYADLLPGQVAAGRRIRLLAAALLHHPAQIREPEVVRPDRR